MPGRADPAWRGFLRLGAAFQGRHPLQNSGCIVVRARPRFRYKMVHTCGGAGPSELRGLPGWIGRPGGKPLPDEPDPGALIFPKEKPAAVHGVNPPSGPGQPGVPRPGRLCRPGTHVAKEFKTTRFECESLLPSPKTTDRQARSRLLPLGIKCASGLKHLEATAGYAADTKRSTIKLVEAVFRPRSGTQTSPTAASRPPRPPVPYFRLRHKNRFYPFFCMGTAPR